MANPFVHVELHTNDLARAKEFYSRLFGWKLQDVPMPGGGGSYTMIDVGGGTGGGMMVNQAPGTPPHWLSYVGVDDIHASSRKAKDLGAKVVVDVTEVSEFGTMSVITIPPAPPSRCGSPRARSKRPCPCDRRGAAPDSRRRLRAALALLCH